MVYGFVTNRTKIVIELIYRVFFTSIKQLLIEFDISCSSGYHNYKTSLSRVRTLRFNIGSDPANGLLGFAKMRNLRIFSAENKA